MKDIITKLAAGYDPSEIKPIGDNTYGTTGDIGGTIINILNGIIGFLAIICVIVIIIGGVTYMTSSGEASKVKKAKDTILYAIIGLIVCALAAAIVNFIIVNVIK